MRHDGYNSIKRWWRLQRARARVRSAEAACRAMPMGPFYECSADDATYYRNVVELDDAQKELKKLENRSKEDA